jgi:uncharacterized protein YbjT (DUF2867 family)
LDRNQRCRKEEVNASKRRLTEALRGVERVFLLWPFLAPIGAAEIISTIQKRAQRIVYLSTLDAEDKTRASINPIGSVHNEVEQLIEQSNLEWTFLRPSGFASNVLLWAAQIKNGNVVHWPFAQAKRSLIHDGDIAEIAAKALVEEGHAGSQYLLTGPETISQVEQLRRIASILGRRLVFSENDPDVVRQQMISWGMPSSFVEGVLAYLAKCISTPEVVTDTVRTLTGRPARPFEDWIRDNIELF